MVSLWMVWCLCALQDPAAGDLQARVEQLASEFAEERREAYEALKSAGAAAEAVILQGLDHDDDRVRRGCMELLTELDSPKALEPAARLFREDVDPAVQAAAFKYLTKRGKDAESVMIEALDRPESEIRLEALRILVDIASVSCAGEVATLFEGSAADDDERDLGAEYFKKIPFESARSFLLRFLDHAEEGIRETGLSVLSTHPDPEILARVSLLFPSETSERCQTLAFSMLLKTGAAAEAPFLEGLKGREAKVRALALKGLTQLKSAKALDAVAAQFPVETDEALQESFLRYLVALGAKSEESLLAGLASESTPTRLRSIRGLTEIGSSRPLQQISKIFREEKDETLHRAAFDYLCKRARETEEDLLLALKDGVLEIRHTALKALGDIGSERAIEPLLELLIDKEGKLRESARDALVSIGAKAMERVQRAVEEGTLSEAVAEDIVRLRDVAFVERTLAGLISRQGRFGYSEGQFQALSAVERTRLVGILLPMTQSDYQPRFAGRLDLDRYDLPSGLRELALMALGVWADEATLPAIEKRIGELQKQSDPSARSELRGLVVAAHRLGKPDAYRMYVTAQLETVEQSAGGEYREDAYRALFEIAMVQSRVGDRAEALKSYERLQKLYQEEKDESRRRHLPVCLYNMACLKALAAETGPALELLEAAVRAGFKDRERVESDGDLTGLRKEGRYQKLLEEKGLFE